MNRETYLNHVRDLLSGDPQRVRDANRRLYAAVMPKEATESIHWPREADLVLAEVPQRC